MLEQTVAIPYDRTEIPPEMEEGDAVSMLTPGRTSKRQMGPRYKTDGTSFALTCQDIHGVAMVEHQKLRIRYLTPRECWRLMGQPDSAYDAAVEAGASNAQLYRQAGNSIVVDCLVAIFEGMYVKGSWESNQTTLGDWM